MATAMDDDQATVPDKGVPSQQGQAEQRSYPLTVLYCGICSFPLEYCEFGRDYGLCKQWMKTNAPDEFDRLVHQVAEGVEGISLEDSEGSATLRKTQKTKGGKPIKKKVRFEPTQRVTVGYAPRGKRKTVTIVAGLATFGIDLKKASKLFSQKFSCGSSVTGDDEIVIQGEVSDEVIQFIRKKFEQVTRDLIKDIGESKR